MRSQKVSEQASAIASGSNLVVAETRVTEQICPFWQATFTPSYMSVTGKLPQPHVLPLIPVSLVPDIEWETGIMPTSKESGDDSGTSVLRSSSVRFFDSQKGNRGPQPVQTVAQTWRTATEPNRTGPIQFGCPKRPVSTSLNYYFYSK
jgi:hypothetical protein